MAERIPNIKILYRNGVQDRIKALDTAQRCSEYTIGSIEPRPQGSSDYSGARSYAEDQHSYRVAASDAGARAVKGLTSILCATNAPVNVRFFRVVTDPALDLDDKDRKTFEESARPQEDRVERFLAEKDFGSIQHQVIERVLIEGNNVVKVDSSGFKHYPLRSIVVNRTYGTVNYFILEEVVNVKAENGEPKKECQYIYVNKQDGSVWVQRESDERAKRTDESAAQYVLVTTELPTINNYARAYYWDHIPLLREINEDAEAIRDAKKTAAWSFATFWPQGGADDIPTSRIAKLKNREVVRLPHGSLQLFTSGQKINDWEFIDRKKEAAEMKLLSLSAVGLNQRAAQANTATEVIALKTELESLVGSLCQVLAGTFYKAVIEATLIVLDIRSGLQQALLAKGIQVDNETMKRLVQPLIVTGNSALAREMDLQRLISLMEQTNRVLGPQVIGQYINVPELLKQMADGLRVNTDGLFNEQPQVQPQQVLQDTTAAEAQAMGPAQLQALLQQRQQGGQGQ